MIVVPGVGKGCGGPTARDGAAVKRRHGLGTVGPVPGGGDQNKRIYIIQDDPLPFCITGLFIESEGGER